MVSFFFKKKPNNKNFLRVKKKNFIKQTESKWEATQFTTAIQEITVEDQEDAEDAMPKRDLLENMVLTCAEDVSERKLLSLDSKNWINHGKLVVF